MYRTIDDMKGMDAEIYCWISETFACIAFARERTEERYRQCEKPNVVEALRSNVEYNHLVEEKNKYKELVQRTKNPRELATFYTMYANAIAACERLRDSIKRDCLLYQEQDRKMHQFLGMCRSIVGLVMTISYEISTDCAHEVVENEILATIQERIVSYEYALFNGDTDVADRLSAELESKYESLIDEFRPWLNVDEPGEDDSSDEDRFSPPDFSNLKIKY